ncbi:MAG: tRNA (N(6)-L-threonylcarbamoyladenosine(37)-C(2))-methylthiotransferase MtaB [Beijerinckiaceae bacterium]
MSIDVVTFGCRLNVFESEAIKRAAEAGAQNNLIVVNTCAVTAEATRQARQSIRRMRRENPDATIVVTGCAAQVEGAAFAAMPEVNRVIGNAEKMRSETWQHDFRALDISSPAAKMAVSDIFQSRETILPPLDKFDGHTRAFLKVQDGCDHRCTFCIIPYGRGGSRSVPMGAVVERVRALVENGTKEVVLTGVDLTSYGGDLPGTPALGALVTSILKFVPELPRLRLSSIDAVEADDDLIDAFATQERLMPSLHLSLQAGDDLILKRMKRRHLRDDAIAFCARLKKLRPDMAFGADVIAGFPTETEDMFQRSLDILEECGIVYLHAFPYSARPGTPAAKIPPVPGDIVKQRTKRLRARGDALFRTHLQNHIGATCMVLTEANGLGHAEDFSLVQLPEKMPRGVLTPFKIIGASEKALIAG